MFGTEAQPEGITNPPIDRLLGHVDSKYGLVLYASQRARQINAYYAQLSEGLLEHVGPLVDPENQEKSLSIALREIDQDKLTIREASEEDLLEEEPQDGPPPLQLGDSAPEVDFQL